MRVLLAVAFGGAFGALARAALGLVMAGGPVAGFPFATLTVNVLGCALMGLLVELSALLWSPGPALRAGLLIGLLGGFTTFSTFAAETHALASQDRLLAASVYVCASVLLSLLAFVLAMHATRAVVVARRGEGP